jgi:hypothetical protein
MDIYFPIWQESEGVAESAFQGENATARGEDRAHDTRKAIHHRTKKQVTRREESKGVAYREQSM